MSIVVDTNSTAGSSLQQEVWHLPAPFKAVSAVTARAVVAISTAGQVALAATDSTASLCVGVAKNAIAAGDSGIVIVHGIAENVPCDGSVSAGDLLKRSATTTGSVAASSAPAEGEVLGVAINASASNVVDVWVGPAGSSGVS
jgi:hypothetical protein